MQCHNRKAFLLGIAASLGLFVVGSSTVQATVITMGCSNSGVACTLEELSNGASFLIDGANFDNWGITDFSSIPVDLAEIDVLPLNDQPDSVGLAFRTDGGLGVSGLDLVDLSIGFELTLSTGARPIDGASFELADYSFGAANAGGFVIGAEDIRDSLGDLIGDTFVQVDNLTPPILELLDATNFAPQSALSIVKTITIGGDGVDDVVVLDEFAQRFSLINGVPEPASPILLFSGLLGLICFRQFRRSSTRASI